MMHTKEFNKLKKNGYVVLENVLSEKKCKNYITILEKLHKKYSPLYVGNNKTKHKLNNQSDEKIVYNLQNKDFQFIKLINTNPIYKIVDDYLNLGSYNKKEIINLRQFTGRSPLPGKGDQQLHIDSRIPGGSFPLMVVVTWMLNDFNKYNGATKLIPKSHKNKSFPGDKKKYKNEKIITGKKGSVLIMDGSLWHGGSLNKSLNTRWSILSTYVRFFYKPAFNYSSNLPKSFFKKINKKQKEILGLTSIPPIDEFTRISSISKKPYSKHKYKLPK